MVEREQSSAFWIVDQDTPSRSCWAILALRSVSSGRPLGLLPPARGHGHGHAIMTAKLNDVDPLTCLADVLGRLKQFGERLRQERSRFCGKIV
jgi:hypothetical protein